MLQRKTLFIASALLVLAVFLAACGSTASTSTDITTVAFEANGPSCSPDKIDTKQGSLVKFTLKNTGTTEVSVVFPDVPYTVTAPPGQTVTGNFTAPTKPGNYEFQCGESGNPTTGKMNVKSS